MNADTRSLSSYFMVRLGALTLGLWLGGEMIQDYISNHRLEERLIASEVPALSLTEALELTTSSLVGSALNKDAEIRRIVTKIFESYPMGLPYTNKADLARHLVSRARHHNFDPFFVLCVMLVESGLNNHAVSRVGASGLMQIMPATGKYLFEKHNLGEFTLAKLFDPYVNIDLGILYLSELKRQFGYRSHYYLAAYNEGPTSIAQQIKKRQPIPSDYTNRILAYYHHFARDSRIRPYLSLSMVY